MITTAYADRIKALRTKRAWTQEELAIASDITVRTVQRVENGHRASPDTLKALANAFEIDVAELVQARVARPTAASDSMLMRRIQTGRDLFDLVCGAILYRFDHGEIDIEKVDLVASFLEDLTDQADLLSNLVGPGDRIRLYNQCTSRIQDVEDAGLCVFARRRGEVATVYVVKNTDPGIVHLNAGAVNGSQGRSGA